LDKLCKKTEDVPRSRKMIISHYPLFSQYLEKSSAQKTSHELLSDHYLYFSEHFHRSAKELYAIHANSNPKNQESRI
jgi:hypothetical protein